MIHDAARPLVSLATITRCIAETYRCGSAIPVIPVTESLRMIKGENSEALNRENYKIVQTPQCFFSEEIKSAYNQDYQTSFTDDASVFESAGKKINLCNGNPENIKITFPSDLHYAEFILLNHEH